jgi:hypothetical protein
VGAKSSGFFLWLATGGASSGQSPVRRAGWLGVPAPDNSTANSATPSIHVRDDHAPGIPARSPWQSASRSTTRWEGHTPWPLSARVAVVARLGARSACTADRVPAWEPRLPRHPAPTPVATATPLPPTPAPGVQPRSSSILAQGGRWPVSPLFQCLGATIGSHVP